MLDHSANAKNVSAILLAGGKGIRLGGPLPKQFLPLRGKPILAHSLETLLSHPEIGEVIVVCSKEYRPLLADYPVLFAEPGERRQDSLYQGFLKSQFPWICVHDAARPFMTAAMLTAVISEGKKIGAVSVGMPVKTTLKAMHSDGFVEKTLEREKILEIQTPQLLSRSLMQRAFDYAHTHQITVTDDVSLAELMQHPVKVIEGSYTNIKITTPDDLSFAEWLDTNS